MTFDSILSRFRDGSIHDFATKIKEGEYPFDILLQIQDISNFPPLLNMAMLQHPDCTVEYFKSKYIALYKKSGSNATRGILLNSLLVESLDIVAYIVGAKENTLESIMENFNINMNSLILIATNPSCNEDLKMTIYQKTGDASLLPQSAQDIFVF